MLQESALVFSGVQTNTRYEYLWLQIRVIENGMQGTVLEIFLPFLSLLKLVQMRCCTEIHYRYVMLLYYTFHLYQSIDVTSESISRHISRQMSQDTIRRISSIREEELRATPRTPVVDESPDEVFSKVSMPDEKPTVMTKKRDAETMTAPEVQEHVGADVIRRQESIITEIVDEPDNIDELRGVPIDHRERRPQIEEVTLLHFNLEFTLVESIFLFFVGAGLTGLKKKTILFYHGWF